MAGRRVGSVWLLALAASAVLVTVGCTPSPSPADSSAPGGPSPSPASSPAPGPSSAAADSPDEILIRAAIDAFDATAGGQAATQQHLLQQLVAPGQLAGQEACGSAKTTLAFAPVYADLAAAPDWRPTRGTLSGTVYSLPTLIRVFTGDRLTGTDLTDLHVSVEGGRAMFSTLCVS